MSNTVVYKVTVMIYSIVLVKCTFLDKHLPPINAIDNRLPVENKQKVTFIK